MTYSKSLSSILVFLAFMPAVPIVGAEPVESANAGTSDTYSYQLEVCGRNSGNEVLASASGSLEMNYEFTSLKIVLAKSESEVLAGAENAATKLGPGWVQLTRGEKGKWAVQKGNNYTELDASRLVQIADHFIPYLMMRKSSKGQDAMRTGNSDSINEKSPEGREPKEELSIRISDVHGSKDETISGWRRTGEDVEVWKATVPPEYVKAVKLDLVSQSPDVRDYRAKIKGKGFLFAVGKLNKIKKAILPAEIDSE